MPASMNSVGKLSSAVGTAPTGAMLPKEKAVSVPNSSNVFMNPQHEFSTAPYSLAKAGIGGTTRRFGGPRW